MNAPTTGERSVARPHGVATSSTMPDASSVIGVAAMSAVPKPYVSVRWPRLRAASTRLWPNASSALITAVRSPGHAKSRAFAAPYAAIVLW